MSSPKANFTLLRDLVMIYPIKVKTESESGVIVVGNLEAGLPIEGLVVAVGPGAYDKKGNFIKVPVAPGDRVVFVKSEAQVIKQGDDSFLVVPSSDVLCKLTLQEE